MTLKQDLGKCACSKAAETCARCHAWGAMRGAMFTLHITTGVHDTFTHVLEPTHAFFLPKCMPAKGARACWPCQGHLPSQPQTNISNMPALVTPRPHSMHPMHAPVPFCLAALQSAAPAATHQLRVSQPDCTVEGNGCMAGHRGVAPRATHVARHGCCLLVCLPSARSLLFFSTTIAGRK